MVQIGTPFPRPSESVLQNAGGENGVRKGELKTRIFRRLPDGLALSRAVSTPPEAATC